ncbi:hypothetical protein A2U01_0054099 [Trifolium medium]|uniref:Uncharacterized protein n=1 Tax=Trifolium medium TaxID=97028 RepID=A0A392RBE5_9FABA|nr:hypothetical protein [Trifolium medium]
MDYQAAGGKRILELNELEELRLDADENVKIYKERTKKWHDSASFEENLTREASFYCLIPVEVWSESTGSFVVNGKRLKHYTTGEDIEKGATITLKEPGGN